VNVIYQYSILNPNFQSIRKTQHYTFFVYKKLITKNFSLSKKKSFFPQKNYPQLDSKKLTLESSMIPFRKNRKSDSLLMRSGREQKREIVGHFQAVGHLVIPVFVAETDRQD
jgi:hypothetical protein